MRDGANAGAQARTITTRIRCCWRIVGDISIGQAYGSDATSVVSVGLNMR